MFGLADFPIEAVVEEAVGEIEEELPVQRFLQAVQAHAVIEQAVDDRVADAVGVFGPRFDAFDLRAKGLAARAAGAVFSDRQFDDQNLAEGNVANLSGVSVFAFARLCHTADTGKVSGAQTAERYEHAVNGFHACVLSGWSW